jgi:hypothetical protein
MDNTTGIAFADLLNVLSLYVGLQNLELNVQQVDGVMKELRENQNAMLATIIKQNEEIIRMLKEKQNA